MGYCNKCKAYGNVHDPAKHGITMRPLPVEWCDSCKRKTVTTVGYYATCSVCGDIRVVDAPSTLPMRGA